MQRALEARQRDPVDARPLRERLLTQVALDPDLDDVVRDTTGRFGGHPRGTYWGPPPRVKLRLRSRRNRTTLTAMLPVSPRHPLVLLLFAIAFIAVVASGAVMPHAHGDAAGIYNQEHDLTSLATFGGPAAVVATGPAILPTPDIAPAHDFLVGAIVETLAPAAASRAPPLA